jgi:aryl-alcohol dehydrogenase-like predicted oxidoreductase
MMPKVRPTGHEDPAQVLPASNDYRKLAGTGLDISRLVLGCMSFGDPTKGDHGWTLGLEDSRTILTAAVEAGINAFDTANGYSNGDSERILGEVLPSISNRDEIVIATKVYAPMHAGPNALGLSRKTIIRELDESLRRLKTDYVDLYQIHRFDPNTPLEETLETLDSLVRAGKVRYLGASSMRAWQFSKALHLQKANGWHRFVSMQDYYNLIYREEELEMHPLCLDNSIGVLPWSPLARGRLTRPWGTATERSRDDGFGDALSKDPSDELVVGAVERIAQDKNVPMAQVALAWLLNRPVVQAPIIGARTLSQLQTAIDALSVSLDDKDVRALEEHYRPHFVTGM